MKGSAWHESEQVKTGAEYNLDDWQPFGLLIEAEASSVGKPCAPHILRERPCEVCDIRGLPYPCASMHVTVASMPDLGARVRQDVARGERETCPGTRYAPD